MAYPYFNDVKKLWGGLIYAYVNYFVSPNEVGGRVVVKVWAQLFKKRR